MTYLKAHISSKIVMFGNNEKVILKTSRIRFIVYQITLVVRHSLQPEVKSFEFLQLSYCWTKQTKNKVCPSLNLCRASSKNSCITYFYHMLYSLMLLNLYLLYYSDAFGEQNWQNNINLCCLILEYQMCIDLILKSRVKLGRSVVFGVLSWIHISGVYMSVF